MLQPHTAVSASALRGQMLIRLAVESTSSRGSLRTEQSNLLKFSFEHVIIFSYWCPTVAFTRYLYPTKQILIDRYRKHPGHQPVGDFRGLRYTHGHKSFSSTLRHLIQF